MDSLKLWQYRGFPDEFNLDLWNAIVELVTVDGDGTIYFRFLEEKLVLADIQNKHFEAIVS